MTTTRRATGGAGRVVIDVAVILAIILAIAGPLIVNEASANRHAEAERDLTRAEADVLEEAVAEAQRAGAQASRDVAELVAVNGTRIAELEHTIAELERRLTAEEAAKAEPVRATASSAPAPARVTAVAGGDAFEALAACESTGDSDGVAPHRIDPAAVSSSGTYRGAFQFSRSTWASVGPAGDPAAAPYAEQRARAVTLQARSGWGPWPTCSRLLGLR